MGIRHKKLQNRKNEISGSYGLSIITSAISGATGGALLGSALGIPGAIIGGLVGAFITGLADYKHHINVNSN